MKTGSRQHSIYTVSITPFTETGELDEAGLRLHLRRLALAGIWIYLAGSGTGEGNSLTPVEMERIFEIGVEEAGGTVPVRAAGIEARTARQAIAHAAIAARAGIDAFQLYGVDLGHALQPNPVELEQYFIDVLEGVSMPVVITTHEYLGYLVPLALLERLISRFDNIVGIICNTTNFGYLVRLLDLLGERLPVHLGRPELGLSMLDLGACGFGMAEANVAPSLCAAALDAYDRGDLKVAHERFAAVLRFYSVNLGYGNVRGVKAALGYLGLPGGAPRPPRQPLGAPERAEVRSALTALAESQPSYVEIT